MPRLPARAACLLGLLIAPACSSPPAADKTPDPPVAARPQPADPDLTPASAPGADRQPVEESAGDLAVPLTPDQRFESFPLEDYPLDKYERVIGEKGRIHCPDVPMVIYKGGVIRYHKPVRVFVDFRDRLRKFEEVVREVAIEVYGRAPRIIQHFGTYNCRRMKGDYKEFISEHAFANAIDVAGFEFGSAKKDERAAAPAGLRGSFTVTIDRHWHGSTGKAAIHSRFLHLLIERLVVRDDIFRVMLGPGYPNHDNHFHFDCAPFRLIDMEGYQ